ncbi:MAG: ABC transporter ATP-binding protein [Candidatus Margulisbacteria bacterium]|jgi:ABC-type dipeptide/oligopeptide/nickel transport system ATPase component|nr:ABC transporter ATP-binding protein [Candidatus Margulisiibacteriota bacterium]
MLEINELTVTYPEVTAVDNVSFAVAKGEALGLVGESGSGKSTIALAIMRLIDRPGKIENGQVWFNGRDLRQLPECEMIAVRGGQISLIFQDPFTSLNPVLTVGDQIAEAVRQHQGLSRKMAWRKAIEMLALVQIREPAQRIGDYPHQFSGGMRQRVMIAMALACQPQLLIADEPTTALDVTIQAEIIRLLKHLQRQLGLSIIYITHNFGIVKEVCDRVAVLHGGKIVESGPTAQVIGAPRDLYTRRLIDCLKVLKGN